MNARSPKPHHTVSEVMRRWPQTFWVFMQHGMACAGCAVGDFHTVEEAALEYRIPLQTFVAELRAAIRPSPRRRMPEQKSPAARRRARTRPEADAARNPSARPH